MTHNKQGRGQRTQIREQEEKTYKDVMGKKYWVNWSTGLMWEKAAWGEEVELVEDISGSESQKGYSCQKWKRDWQRSKAMLQCATGHWVQWFI